MDKSTPRLEELLRLSTLAFDGDPEHSVVGNLRTVTANCWMATPPGGDRSIRQIVGHIGSCKYMYENHAFGDHSLTWSDSLVADLGADGRQDAPMEDVVAWLREGHERLIRSVQALDDEQLELKRPVHWGEKLDTRRIVSILIAHDLYHAGEINHLRALCQENDHWHHYA